MYVYYTDLSYYTMYYPVLYSSIYLVRLIICDIMCGGSEDIAGYYICTPEL